MKETLKRLTIPLAFVLILPILATLIMGYEFQSQVIKYVPFGIVDQDNSSLSRKIVQFIEDNDTFDVVYYGKYNDDLQKQMDSNNIAAGIIIPQNFSTDMIRGNCPSILVLSDGCQMSMAGITKAKVSEILATIRIGASLQIMEAKLNLTETEAMMYIQPIGSETRFLGNPGKVSANYLLPGMISNMVQLAVYLFVVEAIRKEKDLKCPLLYSIPAGFLGAVMIVVTMFLLHVIFSVPMEGSFFTIAVLSLFNMIGIANLGGIFKLLLNEKTAAVKKSTLVMATLLLAGYTYPILAMPKIFQKIYDFIPFTHFGIPLRDVMLLGSSLQLLVPHLLFLIQFTIVSSLVLSLIWLCKRKAYAQIPSDVLLKGEMA